MKLSIVSPVYRAEKILNELVCQISEACINAKWDYEIILVDDRSPDDSWSVIQRLGVSDSHVKGIHFSRNFGQHYAITAGLSHASGDYVVVMDCDLQDSPSDISRLVSLAEQGHDIVLTTKEKRAHGFIKNVFSVLFFSVFNFLADNKDKGSHQIGNFSLLSRKAVQAFLRVQDTHRHYLMIVRMLGFKIGYVPIVHHERFEGTTSYTPMKLIKHALNGLVSQSLRLLYVSIFLGVVFFVLSLVGIGYYLFKYFTGSVAPGFTSLVVLILLQTGLTLLSIGVLGIYVGKIFDQVRMRPLYIVDKTVNFEGNK